MTYSLVLQQMSWSYSKYKFNTHLMMAFTFPGIRSDQTPYFFWIPVSGFSFSIIYLYLPLRIKGDQIKDSLGEDMFKKYKKKHQGHSLCFATSEKVSPLRCSIRN